jgi:hypothetical protein
VSTATIKQVAATGDITVQNALLRNVIVTAGADAASAVIRAGGASGTVVLTVKAAIGLTQATGELGRAQCPGGIHVTATGTAPAITVVYE